MTKNDVKWAANFSASNTALSTDSLVEALALTAVRLTWSYFQFRAKLEIDKESFMEIDAKCHKDFGEYLSRLEDQAAHLSNWQGDLDEMEEDLIASNLNTIYCSYLSRYLLGELPGEIKNIVNKFEGISYRESEGGFSKKNSIYTPNQTIIDELRKFSNA